MQTEIIREQIPDLLAQLKIETLLDGPCRDWTWMRATLLGATKYLKMDIVPSLIKTSAARLGLESVRFLRADLANDRLPKAVPILSRDCLVRHSFEHAFKALGNFQRYGAKIYAHHDRLESQVKRNLETRFWRHLNKKVSSFNFPPPLELIRADG